MLREQEDGSKSHVTRSIDTEKKSHPCHQELHHPRRPEYPIPSSNKSLSQGHALRTLFSGAYAISAQVIQLFTNFSYSDVQS